MVQRVKMGDNEWQRMTASNSEWKRVTKYYSEWYKEWQRVAQRLKANGSKSDFRFQKETITQCITTIYLAMPFWKYNVKQNICRNSHQSCSIEKLLLKLLQYSQKNNSRLATLLKRDSKKRSSCEFCEIFRIALWRKFANDCFCICFKQKQKMFLRQQKSL